MRNLFIGICCTMLAGVFCYSCQSTSLLETKASAKKTLPKKVFLFAGQSNMDGRADGSALSDADLQRLQKVSSRIEFHYNHQPVSPLQLTEPKNHHKRKFNLETCFGPELFFGIEMAEAYPDQEFIFIKRAKGGTSLYGAWNPLWDSVKAKKMSELSEPKLFEDFISYTQAVLSTYDPGTYEISGMLWVQGEDDSNVKKWGNEPAATYGKNLQLLIEMARNAVTFEKMPFLLFQVGRGQVVEGMEATAHRDAHICLIPQSKDKNSDDYYVKNPPPIGHYTTPAMKKMGVAFFNTYQEHFTSN